MARRRVIKSVLRNFLGTYMSRYSENHGYWLFGFLVSDLAELEFNLLSARTWDAETAIGAAETLAATKFEDQIQKAGLRSSQVREARLRIKRSPEVTSGSINGHSCTGYNVIFHAGARMNNDRWYESEQILFVAPHDPRVEFRSGRATSEN